MVIATGGHYGLHIFFIKNVHTYHMAKKEYITVQLTSTVQKQ